MRASADLVGDRDPAPASGIASLTLALFVTALLAVLSAPIVIPARSMQLLIVSVATIEYSPVIALADVAWMFAAYRMLRGRVVVRRVALALLSCSLVISAWPVARFNHVARIASAQIGAGADIVRYSPLDAFRAPALASTVRERTIGYRAADGALLTMRLYRSTSTGPRPTVVVIYGGAWRSGDASQGAGTSRALASRGFTVAAIDYRHAPHARFPAQLNDVRGALTLVRDSASGWNVDTSRIALLGRSSGGQLAELAAWAPGAPHLRAVVALYAPFDLVQGYADLPNPDPIGVRSVLRDFLGGAPREQPAQYRSASPSTWVRAGLPPTLLLYGAADHVVKPDFNRAAAARLRAAHVPVVQVEVPWSEHGFDMAPGGLGEQLAVGVIAEFLEHWLAPATPNSTSGAVR